MRRYLIVAFIVLTALVACNREDAANFIKDGLATLGPRLINAAQATYADPVLREAFAKDGWQGVKETGGGILLVNLKNECMDLAAGTENERRLHEWMQNNSPTLAAMVQRETEQGLQGIWPRLDALAKREGFEAASLHLVFKLTPEQIDYLLRRAPRVIVEEYEAVTGETISESILEGIETGGL